MFLHDVELLLQNKTNKQNPQQQQQKAIIDKATRN